MYLVTGGCGVLGSRVVRRLVAAGEHVVVFDSRRDVALLGTAASEVDLVCGDIRNVDDIVHLIEDRGIRRVAHLAAVLDDACDADPYGSFQINVGGTLNILEAARRVHAEKVVYLSSKSAIGPLDAPYVHPTYEPVPVTVRRNPVDVYGTSKLCTEELARQFSAETGLTVTGLRLASTYGPGKTARHGKVGLLSKIVENAWRGDPVVIARGGEQMNDFVFCDDVAQAVTRALDAPGEGHRLLQIGSGRLASLHDFVDVVREFVPAARISVGEGLDYAGRGLGNYFRFDNRGAQETIGYVPEFDLRRGIEEYMYSLRDSQAMRSA